MKAAVIQMRTTYHTYQWSRERSPRYCCCFYYCCFSSLFLLCGALMQM